MSWSDPQQRKEYHRRYYAENKAAGWNKHLKAETPEERKVRTEKMRAYALKRQWGLSIEQYEQMVRDQDGKCGICKEPPKAKAGRHAKVAALAVDHCHRSGQVRRLLCASCNLRLGWFEKHEASVLNYLKQGSKA